MWMCTVTVCSMRGCTGWTCGKLVCTVSCVRMLTPAHGSCTSCLQWLQPVSLWSLSPGGQKVTNPREHNPVKKSSILRSVSYLSSPYLSFILLLYGWSFSLRRFSNPLLYFTVSTSTLFSLYGHPFLTSGSFLPPELEFSSYAVSLLLHRVVI